MAIAQDRKNEIIKEFARTEGDNGSVEVQVALLTEHIRGLTEHLKVHKKDFGTRRGLLTMVGQRSSLLSYLRNKSPVVYTVLIGRLGLRK
ncbi:MAG: 30S ribosomal protein S15 [Planctomycetes bacterium]|nr:30S ribosomal protein S15 [Planctomycetota bacterium]